MLQCTGQLGKGVAAVTQVAVVPRPVARHVPAQRAERPRDPGGVAAFMSAHSKTPYVTPSMDFPSRGGVVRGRRVQQLAFALLADAVRERRWLGKFVLVVFALGDLGALGVSARGLHAQL